MNKKEPLGKAADAGKTREDRLKSALKANLAKRKAQARAKPCNEAEDRPRDTKNKG